MKNAKKLIIVESPAKSKTIEKYAGSDYKVVACVGHFRDLATSGRGGLGVNVSNNYQPIYALDKDKMQIVNELKQAAKEASEVILATDPDREGEAIAWHLTQVLELDPKTTKRLEFHEITRDSITEALNNPKVINMDLVHSQETRRILDRMIGFELSALLKRKIYTPAAGRVQSASLKIIIDRQNEIDSFIPIEKWDLKLTLSKDDKQFIAEFDKFDGKEYPLKTEENGLFILEQVGSTLVVDDIKIKERKKEPPLPFITSTLQQDAFSRLGLSSGVTMSDAQKLYEGISLGGGEIVGLITYMRTDSTRLSTAFLNHALPYIKERYGEQYLGKNKTGKSKKKSALAQDAHEAIRPTDLYRTPESLKPYITGSQYRLYRLIYNRTIAYLMASRIDEVTKCSFRAGKCTFVSEGVRTLFPGYSIVYDDQKDETKEVKMLPQLSVNEEVAIVHKENIQSFTKPPSQYSEGGLVSAMEKEGIGRPSTYASTIQNLKKHNYITVTKGMISPTFEGKLSTRLLEDYFPSIVDAKYTANMEKDLDIVSEGKKEMVTVLDGFYPRFHRHIEKASEKIDPKQYLQLETLCPVCGAPLTYRHSKFGFYIACSNYPTTCKYIQKEEKVLKKVDRDCPHCGSPLVERRNSKKNETFVGCSNYPNCKYIEKEEKEVKLIGRDCPTCGSPLVERKNARRKDTFVGCSNYPKCKYTETTGKKPSYKKKK